VENARLEIDILENTGLETNAACMLASLGLTQAEALKMQNWKMQRKHKSEATTQPI